MVVWIGRTEGVPAGGVPQLRLNGTSVDLYAVDSASAWVSAPIDHMVRPHNSLELCFNEGGTGIDGTDDVLALPVAQLLQRFYQRWNIALCIVDTSESLSTC
ncbi:MAG: hypothetical protein KatS3mg111_2849 [Pirellulaceae bacterium]|nr:MAG: hypothetical protein KatS3mg111_2849 [Pirellulaceae bacterium]